MDNYTFPSTTTDDAEHDPDPLATDLRRLVDLYGPAKVAVTADAVTRGAVSSIPSTFEALDSRTVVEFNASGLTAMPKIHVVAAAIAAASTFADQMHLTLDAVEMRGALRELRDACDIALTLDGLLA